MAITESIRNWFFSKKPEQEPESQPEPAPVVQEAPPPQKHTIALSPDHPLQKLWAKSGGEGWHPPPELILEGPGKNEPWPDAVVQKELPRLQSAINLSAAARLALFNTKPPAEGEEPPPPPDLDAAAVAFLSSDSMTAWLLAYPPSGEGRELDQEALDDALNAKKITCGLDEDLLRSLPSDPDRYFHLFPVAKGTPPVHGTDGRVVDLFSRVMEHKLVVDEHNRVDYMSLNIVQNVEKDAVICRIIPPTQGEPGQMVTGQDVPAKNGKAAVAPKGRNTYLSEDGGSLMASQAGHVEFSGRTFQVKPLLDIPGNVDYSTGNINFLGDVCIHGDVCSGFTVRAMGNITVEGVVEACTIEAGGDLVVARGIQGDNQAVIRAQQNLFAKYLENSCICVKETIQTDSIINCQVYCDGGIEVRSGRMTIIGGQVHAAHQISAGIIGSRTEGRTDLFLGGQPCGEFDYEELTLEVSQLEIDLEKTERQPDSPDKLNRMNKMRMQLMVNKKKIELLDKARDQLAQDPPDPGLRRMMCDTVYPGTVLTIGGVTYRFDRMLHPCVASLVAGEIQLI